MHWRQRHPSPQRDAQDSRAAAARRTHDSSSLSGAPGPSLKSELTALVDRHMQSPPPELFVLFPDWASELPQILHSQSAAQLKALLAALDAQAELEPELTAAYAFASAALREALGVHVSWGTDAPPPAEGGELVSRLILGAPGCVHEIFPNLEQELRDALLRPPAELRGAARSMEAAQASLEVRRFTEDLAQGADAQLAREAEAMGFAVLAVSALASLKEEAMEEAACERGAEALESAPPRGSEPAGIRPAGSSGEMMTSVGSSAGSSASSAASRRSPVALGRFCFHAFFAEAEPEASGDLFNPCCEGVDLPALAPRASALTSALGGAPPASPPEQEAAWRGAWIHYPSWTGAPPPEPPLPSLLALDNHGMPGALPQPRAISLSTPEPTFPYAATTTPRATTRSKRAHQPAVVARTRRSTRRRLSSEDEVIMRVGVAESFPSALRMDSPNRITDDLLCG